MDRVTGHSTKSLLGIPLITKNKIVGVLEALNKEQGKFSDGDESMLLVLGAQAAVAIENARLFQQSDLISEFVHELRTPLASLSTATYLLLRPEMSREQQEQIIRNIHSETLRLNALASSFLDLARLELGRVQFHKNSFSVADMLYECKDVMGSKAEEEKLHIQIETPDGMPALEADRDKIKQVVLNLLSNAIKYNRPNGSIMLRGDFSASEILIAVQDTGVGIPEDALFGRGLLEMVEGCIQQMLAPTTVQVDVAGDASLVTAGRAARTAACGPSRRRKPHPGGYARRRPGSAAFPPG